MLRSTVEKVIDWFAYDPIRPAGEPRLLEWLLFALRFTQPQPPVVSTQLLRSDNSRFLLALLTEDPDGRREHAQ